MTTTRSPAATLLGTLAAFALLAGVAHAQPFPSRPIRLVVPYGAGGAGDVVARTFAQKIARLVKATGAKADWRETRADRRTPAPPAHEYEATTETMSHA